MRVAVARPCARRRRASTSRSTADGAGTTVVTHRRRTGELDIPFFRWAFRPLVRVVAAPHARATRSRGLRAELEGDPTPAAAEARDRAPDRRRSPPSRRPTSRPRRPRSRSSSFASRARSASSAARSRTRSTRPTRTLSNALGDHPARRADRARRHRARRPAAAGADRSSSASSARPSSARSRPSRRTSSFFTGAQVLQRGVRRSSPRPSRASPSSRRRPKGARAYATSMLALAGGFGFSFSVITLPFADLGALGLAHPVRARRAHDPARAARSRAGSRETDALRRRSRRAPTSTAGRVRDIRRPGYGRRFLLLAAVAFLLNVFSAPSSQLTNKYLTDVHDFSNSGIALFRTVTTGHSRPRRARARRPARRGARPAAGRRDRARRRDRDADGLLPRRRRAAVGHVGDVDHRGRARAASRSGTLGVELFPTETRSTSNGAARRGRRARLRGRASSSPACSPISSGRASAARSRSCGIGSLVRGDRRSCRCCRSRARSSSTTSAPLTRGRPRSTVPDP